MALVRENLAHWRFRIEQGDSTLCPYDHSVESDSSAVWAMCGNTELTRLHGSGASADTAVDVNLLLARTFEQHNAAVAHQIILALIDELEARMD